MAGPSRSGLDRGVAEGPVRPLGAALRPRLARLVPAPDDGAVSRRTRLGGELSAGLPPHRRRSGGGTGDVLGLLVGCAWGPAHALRARRLARGRRPLGNLGLAWPGAGAPAACPAGGAAGD